MESLRVFGTEDIQDLSQRRRRESLEKQRGLVDVGRRFQSWTQYSPLRRIGFNAAIIAPSAGRRRMFTILVSSREERVVRVSGGSRTSIRFAESSTWETP